MRISDWSSDVCSSDLETSLTWIVGKLERKLVGDLPGVEFVTFDKAAGWTGMRAVHAALKGRRFDALLQMQVAMRSNLLSMGIKAERRIGYDHARARDLHGLVINEHIPARSGEHVLDAIRSFEIGRASGRERVGQCG